MLEWFFRGPFVKFSYKFFIKRVSGLGNIPKKTGFIVAANHSSYLDIIILTAVFLIKKNMNIRYIAKKELFTNWLFKKFEIIFQPIPVDRGSKGKEVIQKAIKALKKGDIIGVYPEGKRTLTGKLQKGKTGVARMALAAKVPVVPVGLIGTFELMPKGRIIPKFKKNIIINIGKPIYFRRYYGKQNKTIYRKVTAIVMGKIAELSKQR
jgi:1-acyl-sn-glycerol-3-phosphate acyltransferase